MSTWWRRVTSFQSLVWTVAIAIALFLSCGPLMMNAWASWKWQKVPCWVKGNRYFFTFEGQKYYSGRLDFWQSGSQWEFGTTEQDFTPTAPHTPNDGCYVNGSIPPSAVLRLDAHQHLNRGGRRFFLSGFVLVVAFGLNWVSARRKRARHQPKHD